MQRHFAASYTVGNNIDASGTTNASDVWGSTTTSGTGFIPIGITNGGYIGTFNGQNNTVSNLSINDSSGYTAFAGLFGVTVNATISNIGLVNVNVNGTGGSNVGGLIGQQGAGSLTNAYVTGTVSGNTATGGLVGVLPVVLQEQSQIALQM